MKIIKFALEQIGGFISGGIIAATIFLQNYKLASILGLILAIIFMIKIILEDINKYKRRYDYVE